MTAVRQTRSQHPEIGNGACKVCTTQFAEKLSYVCSGLASWRYAPPIRSDCIR